MGGAIEDTLRALGTYDDLASYGASFGDDWLAFFERCPRGDWYLAIAARFGAEPAALARAASACAREALSYLHAPQATLEGALALLEDWTRGERDAAACSDAGERVAALPPAQDAVEDVAVQAVAAALATPREAIAAAHAASCAAQAAVLAAGDCAMQPALRFTQEKCATLARAELPPSTLVALARRAVRS